MFYYLIEKGKEELAVIITYYLLLLSHRFGEMLNTYFESSIKCGVSIFPFLQLLSIFSSSVFYFILIYSQRKPYLKTSQTLWCECSIIFCSKRLSQLFRWRLIITSLEQIKLRLSEIKSDRERVSEHERISQCSDRFDTVRRFPFK